MRKLTYILLFLFAIHTCVISQITLSPFTTIYTDSWAEVVKVVDINNDGKNDIILGTNKYPYYQYSNDYSIMVFTQNNAGMLNSPVNYSFYIPEFKNYPFISQIISLDAGDLNQDGLNDIIIGYGDRYGIFYQNKSGTLNNIESVYLGNWELVESVRIGDVNGDHINDIVILSYNAIRILTQNDDGSFKTTIMKKVNCEQNRYNEMEIADINNDGRNDIITSSAGAGRIDIYCQTDSGTIREKPVSCILNSWIWDFSVGDLNGDHKIDIATTKSENDKSKVKILYQNESANLFDNYTEVSAYELPDCIKIADLNNNGVNEIITAHGGWCNLSCYSSKQNLFSGYQSYDLPYQSSYGKEGFDVGDINNDGLKDIAIADYNRGLLILYNQSKILSTNIDISTSTKIAVYPNPTSDFIHINKNSYEYLFADIFNTNGNLILKENISSNCINIKKLIPGYYLLILYDKLGNHAKINFIKK